MTIIKPGDIACANQIDLPDGLRIWVPPTGRPYWVGKLPGRAGPDLSDDELERYGLRARPPMSESERRALL